MKNSKHETRFSSENGTNPKQIKMTEIQTSKLFDHLNFENSILFRDSNFAF